MLRLGCDGKTQARFPALNLVVMAYMTRFKLTLHMAISALISVAIVIFIYENSSIKSFIFALSAWASFSLPAAIASAQLIYSYTYKSAQQRKSLLIPSFLGVLFSHLLMALFHTISSAMEDYNHVSTHHDGFISAWFEFAMLSIVFGGFVTFPLGIISIYVAAKNFEQ